MGLVSTLLVTKNRGILSSLNLGSLNLPHLTGSTCKNCSFKISVIVASTYFHAELAEVPLIRLDFSCNKITAIPVCYRNLRHLQVITLDNNPLQSPPAQVIMGKVCWRVASVGPLKEILCASCPSCSSPPLPSAHHHPCP